MADSVGGVPAVVAGGKVVVFTVNPKHSLDDVGASFVAWLEEQGKEAAPDGVIVPLEVPIGGLSMQELPGLALLEWLRWSADEKSRSLPVLATAFQPLEAILRRTAAPLLLARGTEFRQLPCSRDIEAFVREVETRPRSSQAAISGAVGLSQNATGRTRHDLANEGYAAWRLRVGYRAALQAELRQESIEVTAAWRDKIEGELQRTRLSDGGKAAVGLEAKCRAPWFRSFQASIRAHGLGRAPFVEVSSDVRHVILKRHLEVGLPKATQILLVDDQYDDLVIALNDVLFCGKLELRPSKDGRVMLGAEKGNDGLPQARLFCVRSHEDAEHWLRLSHHFPTNHPQLKGDQDTLFTFVAALRSAQGCAEWTLKRPRQDESYEDQLDTYLKSDLNSIDKQVKIPFAKSGLHKPKLVCLLDLRLTKGLAPDLAHGDSFALREVLKAHRKRAQKIPVIVWTASEQVQEFIAGTEGKAGADAWLVKEAPDHVGGDNMGLDANSANAALRLLAAVFEAAHGMERLPQGTKQWDPDLFLQYLGRTAPKREREEDRTTELERQVAAATDQVLKSLSHGTAVRDVGPKETVNAMLKNELDDLVRMLVARRIVLTLAARTAVLTDGQLEPEPKNVSKILTSEERTEWTGPKNGLLYGRPNVELGLLVAESVFAEALEEEARWLISPAAALDETHRSWLAGFFAADVLQP